ncbi:sulfite exporter TauE/SafE family protein [Numidum massiliense]|uniref:sulfite exporter TauE/SafE family protein n=1 Tax=Numidum massiliense TaxID=1522315 RepID=UPI0006D5AEC8|nr:sulfite exporter TauE/SafE family protein [Numidum massiliense]
MAWDWALLLATGILAGTLGSLAGLGGGIVVVPVLLLLAGTLPDFASITPAVAAGSALVVVVINGLSATFAYARQRRVDFKSGLLFFAGSGPGSYVGAFFSTHLSVALFNVLFGVLIVVVALLLKRGNTRREGQVAWKVKRHYEDEEGKTYVYGYSPLLAVVLTFMIGLVGGLFGIGGGLFFVPLMVLLFRFPPHLATATSMFVIFLSSLTGSVTHTVLGNVYWWAVLWLAPGAWLGAKFGAAISRRMSVSLLVTVLQVIFILLGVYMIWGGLTA